MRAWIWMVRGTLVVSTLLSLTACDGGVCGVGTVRYGDTCVAVDPFDKTPPKVSVDPPLYTREVGTVRLVSDEPATIYYTVDGTSPTLESASEPDVVVIPAVPDNTQLRYFAVDLAGNRSNEELRIWIIDRDGPGAPQNFRLQLAGSTRSLSWNAPTDPRFGGVIVARVDGQLAGGPESGKAYAVGDTLGPGITVVATSAAQGPGSFSETLAAPPGLVRYVAWAFDDLDNYGPPTGDYAVVPMPAQSGSVTVDVGAASVSVGTQPSVLSLSGDATVNGTTLTLHLTLRNDSARVLYAPKLVLNSTLPSGVTWTNSSGTVQTKPYKAYGAAILPGTTSQQTWTFTGVSGATTLTLDVDVRDGKLVAATRFDSVTAGLIVDFETGNQVLQLSANIMGNGNNGTAQRGGITPDGRVIVGSRTAGTVSSFDLVTGTRQVTATLRQQKAQVPQVILDRSGSAVYALVADGHPYNINNNQGAGSDTDLVMLDAGSLAVGARLPIGTSRNRDIAISPDGTLMMIATGLAQQGVILVDLATLTIRTRLMPGFRPNTVLFAPDGSLVVVGEQIAVYTIEGTRTALWDSPGTSGKVVRATFGINPNELWIGRRSQIAKIDLRDGTSSLLALQPTTPTPPSVSGRLLEMFEGKLYIMTSSGNLSRVDPTTSMIETTMAGFSGLDAHWVARSPF